MSGVNVYALCSNKETISEKNYNSKATLLSL